MSWTPSLTEQELLAGALRRAEQRMSKRERVVELMAGVGFGIAVAGLWALRPPHWFELWPALLCTLVLALASRVRFETPFGHTAATQLAFVPLLFSMPVALVPAAVFLALTIARARDVARGLVAPSRLGQSAGNSWWSVWPAAVFALAGVSPQAARAPLLIGALGAQFAGDFAFSATRLSLSRVATLASQLRDSWVYGIDAALSCIGILVARYLPAHPVAVLALVPLLGLLAVFARERHRNLSYLLELNTAYRGTALVLGDVIEADDGYTGEHCRSVVALTLAVGERLGLDADRRRNLEFGALLHDVGKITVPKTIINKPARLSPEEWIVIKTHTVEGQRMLERIGGFMGQVGLIVRSHHERWDGGGYPDGLSGEAIPLEARIIACCDTWNAMRTDRAYRQALSFEVAMAELRANSGTQFDPRVVEALIMVVDPHAQPRAARAPTSLVSLPTG